MAIASVVQGTIEAEGGKVFELDSPKGSAWLESCGSFRYVPTGANKPFTVRKEAKKGGDYWYGYRKVAGKLHKKYIGKSSELSTATLEEIAEGLNTPQQSRVTQQVTDGVAQVTEVNNQRVTDTVTDNPIGERVTALEMQVQALRESVEELRSMLLGKSEGLGNSELLNPDEVTQSELQTELGNLKAENERLQADYAKLLESSTHVTNKLRQELAEVRSQLDAEKARGEEMWEELSDTEEALAEIRAEKSDLQKTCAKLQSELADLKQKSATAGKDLPEAADLLNQLKTRRKKSSATLADIEIILEMIEES